MGLWLRANTLKSVADTFFSFGFKRRYIEFPDEKMFSKDGLVQFESFYGKYFDKFLGINPNFLLRYWTSNQEFEEIISKHFRSFN